MTASFIPNIARAEDGSANVQREAKSGPGAPTVRGGMKVNSFVDNDGNRIMSPLTSVKAEVSEDLSVGAHAAYDVMSCASVDVISAATPKGKFSEVRKEYGANVELRSDMWIFTTAALYSLENDFLSLTGSVGASRDFAQRNTTVGLGYSYSNSTVGRALDNNFQKPLLIQTGQASLTQVLNPRLIAQFSYYLSQIDGFQESPYRTARFIDGTAGPENVPDRRQRHATALRKRWAITNQNFLSSDYRFYLDTWGIQSHTLELGFTQTARPWFTWRVRSRLYSQSGTDFYRSIYESHKGFKTADRELGPFTSGMAGAKTTFYLGDLLPLQDFALDFKVDVMKQSFSDYPQLNERLMLVTEIGLSTAY